MTTGSPPPIGPGRPSGGRRSDETPSRRRVRSLLPLLTVVWVIAEIWLLLLLGRTAGGLTVVLVLLAGFVAGSLVLRRAGRRALRNLNEAVQAAQQGRRLDRADSRPGNGLSAVGGILLMVPGLISDVLGLLLIFPPTAALVRSGLSGLLVSRAGPLGSAYQEARAADARLRMQRPDGKVVQGEVLDDDDPRHGPDAPPDPHRPDGETPGDPPRP
ncbi:FxsA family membrane protein [Streptomyces spiramenti]|uniref:FxsA family protein n=1 Tax=Streptomyces spiramenti TaxID=2720606 RepID=A0ABX1AND5_9ACTN|nr:FxsA family membrane protein [Streptomyces spiramenti]NJP68603.1 FxsA family protein [Streptomyces spiramenti]